MADRKVWPTDYHSDADTDSGIRCPKCNCPRSHVRNTAATYGNRRWRRRVCANCAHKWTTFES